MPYTETAWNGISIHTPGTWSVSRIGRRYLLFEKDSEPVLEIKWGPVRGAFSFEKQLKRLSGSHSRPLRRTIRPRETPDVWAEVLGGYDTAAFSWQGERVSGAGLMIFCPSCRTAALLQFMRRRGTVPKETARQVLGSFRDHFDGVSVPYRMFDVHADVPAGFRLTDYQFSAGYFHMGFTRGKQVLAYDRFSPADVLLAQTEMTSLALNCGLLPSTAATLASRDDGTWEWQGTHGRKGGGLHRWVPAVLAARRHGRVRMARLTAENRILGVSVTDRHPVDADFFERIWEGYGTAA